MSKYTVSEGFLYGDYMGQIRAEWLDLPQKRREGKEWELWEERELWEL